MRDNQDETSRLLWARMGATSHETGIPSGRRKRLGQFFTGVTLARLLAAISVRENCRRVIDPMAGTGDLLDAVIERSHRIGLQLEQLGGIEICDTTAAICRDRISAWHEAVPDLSCHVHAGSAFAPGALGQLDFTAYDLVITNPPYVRYQTTSRNGADGVGGDAPETVRDALLRAVSFLPFSREAPVWRALVRGYSGLSDLSVPSWLLGAMLVKPGGTLALVAPATWRTRDYADVLLYVLARFFRLDVVVADRQRGWFSSALVRTQLVVATRLQPEETEIPLAQRERLPGGYQWIEIAPEAQGGESLVGTAFPGDDPESDFSAWLFAEEKTANYRQGIHRGKRLYADETADVMARCARSEWLPRVEPLAGDLPLFSDMTSGSDGLVPQVISAVLDFHMCHVCKLEGLGVKIGQGLRTGCNDFFYVDFVEYTNDSLANVLLSPLFGRARLAVPVDVLIPVLRRQSELELYEQGLLPSGRILDLRQYVLPEDRKTVEDARDVYARLQQPPPAVMPEELAGHVRRAATMGLAGAPHGGRISELTAVRTNARAASIGSRPSVPRFWYMLPDLARRHRPDAFVPRVNQLTPLAVPNRSEPIAIDANFSTLWSDERRWTPTAISALLRSTWSRACMEAIGTPMGGGALKLEATQLKRLPVPRLEDDEIERLNSLGGKYPIEGIDGVVIGALLKHTEGGTEPERISRTRERLQSFIESAQLSRQRR